MSNNKYNVAKSVIALIEKERSSGLPYHGQMRDYLLRVIEIMRANDPSPRKGCGYTHTKYMDSCSHRFDNPSNGRADDYYEHGSH